MLCRHPVYCLVLIELAACQTLLPVTDLPRTGSDRDSHGRIPSAAYRWDDVQQQCARPWENPIHASGKKN